MARKWNIGYDRRMSSFGAYLRIQRKQRGLSLRDLEKEVGISHNTLALYEREKAVPSIVNGFRIAEYFGLPLEYFLKGKAVISEFRDATLRALLFEVDRMEDNERQIVKSYLERFVRNKQEHDDLASEAESE